MKPNYRYLVILLCSIVLIWNIVHTKANNQDIVTESISDLVTEIIATAKARYPIGEDAYVAFEITVDGEYNNILLDISLYGYNQKNELVEYTFTKQNNGPINEDVNIYTDIRENPNNYLTVNQIEELFAHIEEIQLNAEKEQNFLLTTREFTIDSHLGNKPLAYSFSEGIFYSESIDRLVGNIGICITEESVSHEEESCTISIIYK